MFKKLTSSTIIFCFFLTTLGPIPKAHGSTGLTTGADSILNLPAPGTMVSVSPNFEPALIKGLTVHKDNPFLFDFIVDPGDAYRHSERSEESLKEESDRMIKYFFAALTIPDKDIWVNLSPYEKDRMIPVSLGQTAMGRDLLAQDYMLKQLTASLIYPQKALGKTFWQKVYSKAKEMYGTTQVPVNTFNKVWIVPQKAGIYEHGQTAFIVSGHLKVMLEEDYLALEKNQRQPGDMALAVSPSRLPSELGLNAKATQRQTPNALASQIIRAIILPELEKEVNEGKNFATLRQIFYAQVLAVWFKRNLKQALLNQVYANKGIVKGIERPGVNASSSSSVIASEAKQSQQDLSPEQIYHQYLKAYKKGVFNYIQEESFPPLDGEGKGGVKIARKYFSGGYGDSALLSIEPAELSQTQVAEAQKDVDFAVLAIRPEKSDAAMPGRIPVNLKDKIAIILSSDKPEVFGSLNDVKEAADIMHWGLENVEIKKDKTYGAKAIVLANHELFEWVFYCLIEAHYYFGRLYHKPYKYRGEQGYTFFDDSEQKQTIQGIQEEIKKLQNALLKFRMDISDLDRAMVGLTPVPERLKGRIRIGTDAAMLILAPDMGFQDARKAVESALNRLLKEKSYSGGDVDFVRLLGEYIVQKSSDPQLNQFVEDVFTGALGTYIHHSAERNVSRIYGFIHLLNARIVGIKYQDEKIFVQDYYNGWISWESIASTIAENTVKKARRIDFKHDISDAAMTVSNGLLKFNLGPRSELTNLIIQSINEELKRLRRPRTPVSLIREENQRTFKDHISVVDQLTISNINKINASRRTGPILIAVVKDGLNIYDAAMTARQLRNVVFSLALAGSTLATRVEAWGGQAAKPQAQLEMPIPGTGLKRILNVSIPKGAANLHEELVPSVELGGFKIEKGDMEYVFLYGRQEIPGKAYLIQKQEFDLNGTHTIRYNIVVERTKMNDLKSFSMYFLIVNIDPKNGTKGVISDRNNKIGKKDFGGIDLSQQDAALRVEKDANGGVKVNVDPALIARIEREGMSEVVPVIINMRPADIQSLFGVKIPTNTP